MKGKKTFILLRCAVLLMSVGALCLPPLHAQGAAPKYQGDTSWPKPLPQRWVLGAVGAVCVDAHDHVLLLNRQEVLDVDLDAGEKAPPVIELDPAGNVIHSWEENAFDKPLIDSFHSCRFDSDDNVWILSNESGMVRKYSHDGSKLLLQIGKSGVVDSSDGTPKGKPLNSDTAQFFAPADINVDRQNGDVYVDD